MIDFTILNEQLINGLVLGSIYGLIAIGYSLVYGILGMINFAHGDVYMIGAYLTAIGIALCHFFGINSMPVILGITFIFAVMITGGYGWAIERLAYRPLRYSTRLAPLISAIGMSLLLENFVRISQGARNQAVPMILQGDWGPISYIQIAIVVVTLLSTAVLALFIAKTPMGRAMRATQQDMEMAQILGVNLNKIIPLVFVLGAFMAAIAGMLVTINFGSFNFFIGFVIGIKAFTSAVLGGIGSLPGALLGGLILGLTESLFSGYVSVDYKDVFAFAVLIIVLIFKPSGILGKTNTEKV
jgi:branched-chain amino acid transport system permease protein